MFASVLYFVVVIVSLDGLTTTTRTENRCVEQIDNLCQNPKNLTSPNKSEDRCISLTVRDMILISIVH